MRLKIVMFIVVVIGMFVYLVHNDYKFDYTDFFITVLFGGFFIQLTFHIINSKSKDKETPQIPVVKEKSNYLIQIDNEKREREEQITKLKNLVIEHELNYSKWEKEFNSCRFGYGGDIKRLEIKINNEITLKQNKLNREINLTKKYKYKISIDNLNELINTGFFIGMTEQMLIDSFGKPNKIFEEVLKTKTKRTFSYYFSNKRIDKILIFEADKLVRYRVYEK